MIITKSELYELYHTTDKKTDVILEKLAQGLFKQSLKELVDEVIKHEIKASK